MVSPLNDSLSTLLWIHGEEKHSPCSGWFGIPIDWKEKPRPCMFLVWENSDDVNYNNYPCSVVTRDYWEGKSYSTAVQSVNVSATHPQNYTLAQVQSETNWSTLSSISYMMTSVP